MKLIGYTCAFNEAEYVPYVMPFVERMGYDKFIVYDNDSTDNTVELLSKYPFVEIRRYDTCGVFDDNAKLGIQLSAYQECFRMAKIGTSEEEDVFMTFTDFDEVYFFLDYRGETFKSILDNYIKWGLKANFLSKPMINLLPPREYINSKLPYDIFDALSRNQFRACVWDMGHKPSLLKVNDFMELWGTEGNHVAWVKMRDNRKLEDVTNTIIIYPLHLKYININILRNKTKSYTQKNRYFSILDNLDNIVKNLYIASFPLEQYMCEESIKFNNFNNDGLFEKQNN